MKKPRSATALAFAIALLAGCAARAPHPEAFAFAVLGDTPYDLREERELDSLLARMSAEPLAFVVHVGDFKAGGNAPCTDALYDERKARFETSRHPLVLTPGDNDWTDCRRESNGKGDPLERLARLRAVFFADEWSLGRTRMPIARQEACVEHSAAGCACPALPENRLWSRSGVVFATIHVVGSNDNRGFDAANDAEQRCREKANLAWLDRAFRLAAGAGQRGLVILTHANPWMPSKQAVYDPLLARIAAGARLLARPVLFVNGDTHTYRVDRPFRDSVGQTVANATRLEVFGSPQAGWVRVVADPADPSLFRFEPRLPQAPGD